MRRAFRFRLGRLLRVREIEERVARATWGRAELEAVTAEQEEAARRDELKAAREHLRRRLGPRSAGPLDPTGVLLAEQAIEDQRAALARIHEVRVTLRDQADREADALEGRERDRHRFELARLEDAQRDEEALAKGIRDARTIPPARADATAASGIRGADREKDSSGPPFASDR